LASHADPRKGLASPELGLAFARLYHSYREEDPAPKPQLALPVSVFQNIMETEGASVDPKQRAMADLVVIAFFFLLRVGKCTPPSGLWQTRTTQLRHKDMQFWRMQPDGIALQLSHLSTLSELLAADAVNYHPRKPKEWSA
jgi:hypothetical protein